MSDFYQLSPEQQGEHIAQLARAALSSWGIGQNAEISLLKYRENAVYAVESCGTRYALRVHRPGYHSDDALLSELEWMNALNQAGIKTPFVQRTLDGKLFETVSVEQVPEPRQVDILAWVDGEALGSIEDGTNGDTDKVCSDYRIVGEMMAKLHSQAQQWQKPACFTRHSWDLNGLLGEMPLWGPFWELEALTQSQLELLQRARTKARSMLLTFGQAEDRYGLIHCDFLPENLLCSKDGLRLIDFDDSGFGWHLFDIATSLFFISGEENFDHIFDAFLKGYRSQRELPESHLEMLPTFSLIRGLVYLGWAHSRKETETAKEITPVLVETVMALASNYLDE